MKFRIIHYIIAILCLTSSTVNGRVFQEYQNLSLIEGSYLKPSSGRCGYVPYSYFIGEAEVNNEEYAYFLNAVASDSDPKGLFNPLMSSHFWGGITRVLVDGNFHYKVKNGYSEFPVNFVSFYDIVRYVNWLHFGKPRGEAVLGITEGNNHIGSYDTTHTLPQRNDFADYVIPNCDEWSKAAFFNTSTGKYTDWITDPPTESGAIAKASKNSANVSDSDGFANPFPHLAPVRAYGRSRNGTFGQAGNVMEWTESKLGADQRVMGGSLFMNASSTKATYLDSEKPDHELATFGFRIAKLLVRLPEAARNAAVKAQLPEFVRVEYSNNKPDLQTGRGFVGQEFEIQRTEISVKQYVDFLNAVAKKDDRAGLFRKDMQEGVAGGIIRTGKSGQWTYSSKPGWDRRAASYISWFSLARMANWRHFGSPVRGQSVFGTTEGDATSGAYDTRAFPTANQVRYDPQRIPSRRNIGARYFIPNEDEWYKAAYFDPSRKQYRKYWDYPTKSDSPPAQGGSESANYQVGDRLAEGDPFFIADVESFGSSASPMGTLQQGGNLWEWIEDWRSKGGGDCWRCDEWTKGLRGGSFNYTWRGLRADNLDPATPDQGYFVHGGRIARSIEKDGWRPVEPTYINRIIWRLKDIYHSVTGIGVIYGIFASIVGAVLALFARRFLRLPSRLGG